MERQQQQKEQQKEPQQHNYRDFSTVNTSDTRSISLLVGGVASQRQSGPGRDPPFPVKLHYALGHLSLGGFDHIFSWQPHGRCVFWREEEDQIR